MATAFNMKTYIRNVVKSVGYVTIESAKELNPIISEFASTNSDVAKNIYTAARNYKQIARQGKQSVADSEYTQIARETVSNIISDLKTGNFYNKARQDKYGGGAALGIDLDDWDFSSLDVDLDDINIDDDNSLTMTGMDDIGEKIVKGTGKATIQSADYIVRASRANAKGIMAQNELLFANLNNTLGGINSTIISVGKSVLKPSMTHFENSSKFYAANTSQMAEQTGYLKQIYELINERYNPKKQSSSGIKNRYSNVMGSGSLDLEAYGDVVKENFKEMTSLITSMASMMTMGGQGNMLRYGLSSPLSSLMKMGVTGIGKKAFGKDLDRLNKSITGLFGSSILKMNRMGDKDSFSLAGLIGNLLGIKPSSKKGVDSSKYDKGRMDWSGKDVKALREVIPTQLALILSALTGQEAKVFNYESGKWVNYSNSQKSLVSNVKNITKSNTRDIQDQFDKYFLADNTNVNRTSKAFHTFQQDMNNFFHYLTMHNDKIPLSPNEWRDLEKRLTATGMFGSDANPNGMMLKSNFTRIKNYYARNVTNKKGYLNTTTNGALINSRNEVGRFYQSHEADASSPYGMLFNGSGLGKPSKANMSSFAVDDKGNNAFFYFQSFYRNLERIADNTEGGVGGTRRTSNRRRGSRSYDVPNNISKKSVVSTKSDRFVDVEDSGANDQYYSQTKKKEKAEEMKDRFTNFLKSNKYLKRLGKGGEIISAILDAPIKGLRSAIDYADNTMYNMVYGKDNKKENPGILAKIMQGFDDTFKSIKSSAKTFFKETFSPIMTALADKMSNMFGFDDFGAMKGKIFNGIKNSGFVTGVKDNLKSAGKWAKNAVGGTLSDLDTYFTGGAVASNMKGLFGKVSGFGAKHVRPAMNVAGSVFNRGRNNDHAANGGFVTKSGMISVSEGEMIVPSEKNPYYNGYVSKNIQLAKERSVANRWKSLSKGTSNYWGEYANGGTAEPRKNKSAVRMFKRGARFVRERKTRAANKMRNSADDASDAASQIVEDTLNDVRDTEIYKRTIDIFDQVSSIVKNGAISVTTRLFGKTTDKDGNPLSESEMKKNTSDATKAIWDEVKKNAPRMAAGGIIGGGAALLTGMVGGPLVGAAAGAAIGLATQSDAFREKLFGKGYKDGEYDGGIFGPKLSKLINEKGAKLAKFGLTGGLGGMLGLIPGGPIAGIIAGTALSFATESDGLKNYLFGDEGLLGKDTDKKVKKALPKMGLGAASLALTGPFGLIGNMMLGAGIGYVSESEKFKEAIFGVVDSNGQRQGGLLGTIRKEIIDPMGNYFKGGAKKFEDYMVEWVFKPVKNVLRPVGNMIGRGLNQVTDFLKGQFSDKIITPFMKRFDRLLGPVARVAGRVGKGAISIARNIGTLPGRALNRVGKELDRKAIRGGYSSLSAEERAMQGASDWYLSKNKYGTKEYDKRAASMNLDQLQSARDSLEVYRGNVTGARVDSKEIRQNVMNRILADSKYGTTMKEDRLLRKELNNSISTGGLNLKAMNERVNQMVGSGKIEKDQARKLKQYLRTENGNLKDLSKQADQKRVTNKASKAAEQLGINLDDYMSDRGVRRLVGADLARMKSSAKSNKPQEAQSTVQDKATPTDMIIHPITEVRDILTKTKDTLASKLDSILVTVGKIAGIDIPDDSHEESNSSNSQNLKGIRRRIQTATIKNAKVEADKQKEQSEDNNTKVETTDDGSVIEYKKDSTGNWMANLRDSVTSKFLKNKRLESKMNQDMATTIISAGSVFTGLKSLLFNKDKKKKEADPGLFDSLFGGKASGLKMIGGSLLATLGIGNLAHMLVPEDYKTGGGKKGNLITNTVRGFGDIQNVLTGHKPGTYKDDDYERQTIADRYVSQGLVKNSLIKGQTGNKILKAVPIVGKGTNAVLSGAGKVRNWGVDKIANTGIVQKGIKAASGTKVGGAVGSLATGSSSIVRKGIQSVGNTKIGKLAGSVGEKAGKVAGKVVDSGIMSKITSLAQSALSKAFSLMGVKGGEAIAKEGAEQLGKAAAEAGAEKVAKSFAKSAALPVQIAFVAAAVENGFEDAKSILGIIDSPSMPERILAAAINGINEAVPGIGGVVPSEYIFNILFTLLNATGLVDLSGLQEKREDAKAVVADYNQTNGTTYNVREYIKNVLGEYTTQEKIGRGLKKAGGAVVKGVKTLAKAHGDITRKVGKGIVKGAKFVINAQLSAPKKAIEAVSKAKQDVVKSFGIVSKVVGDKLTPSKKFDMKDFIKNIWEYTDTRKHKDMNGIDELIKSPMVDKGTIGDVINATNATIVGNIMKFIVNLVRPFAAIKDFAGNIKNDIKESGGVGNWVKDTAGKGVNAVKNFFGFGKKPDESASGSGVHVSQRDPNFAGSKFGKRTIGENGCGPAVAATILNRYGRNGSLSDTANYAKANGYVAGSSGVGTKASYFGDILGSNGISSSYTSNNKDIQSAIRSGRPTVLLGQDSKNTSKTNSPFGPNNHYVVAQGMDRRGNVVIDDPELGGTALYKNKVLNSAKLGVITGGNAGLGGDYVGKYVKEFESGSKGSAMISSGKGDFGGVSFGTYQFPTKNQAAATGNLLLFWNKYYASQYPGIIPGNNQAFKSAWTAAVNKDPSGFFKNEHEFVSGLYYNPIASKLASNGVGDPTGYDRAAQEAAWSTSVQYGATSAANLFAKAGVNNSMKPADYIKKLYDYKKNSVGTSFKSSSASMKSGIVGRFEKEKNLLLGIAGKGPIDPKSTNGVSSTVGPTSGFNSDSSSMASQSDSSSGDIGSILDNAINGVFTKVLGGLGAAGKTIGSIFGISSPSTESGDSTGADSSGTQNTNFSKTSNTKQENEIVNKMSSLFGQFGYSQKNRTNFVQGGSADCSSTVQHVLKSTIGVDPGGDTGSQLSSVNGRIVDSGVGAGPKESNLKPGDLLFYKRGGSSKPKGVGHVEMYMGSGQRAGHGGGKNSPYGTTTDGKGKGPYASPLDSDGKNYIEAKRFTTAASGSGLRLIDFTNKSNSTKGATNQVITNLNSNLNKVGGASGMMNSDSAKLIETALEYMKIIANNTSYNSNLKIIVEVLNSMMTILGGSIANRAASSESNDEQSQQLESDMKDLMSKLKSLSVAV